MGVAVNPVFRDCSAQSKNEKILLFDFLREEMVTKEFFVSFDKINIIIKIIFLFNASIEKDCLFCDNAFKTGILKLFFYPICKIYFI